MKAQQFIEDHGLEQARNLLGMLKNLGCPDDMKFTVINGMWHRSSEGFTYDDLSTAIADHDTKPCLHGYDIACLICGFGEQNNKRVYHSWSKKTGELA